MLLKILPEQVSDNWDKFAPLIEKSLPPTVVNRRHRMANVLRSILMEDLVVWIYYDEEGRERYVVSTEIRHDKITLSKNLLIYTWTAIGKVTPSMITEGLDTLRKYSEGNECGTMMCYVQDLRVLRLLEQQEGNANFAFVQWEV